jgi:hypothetical protein
LKKNLKIISLVGTIIALVVLALILQPTNSDNLSETEGNNTNVISKIQNGIAFSHIRGFYNSGFYLELKTIDANATIYYTLDGSVPDPIYNKDQTFEYVEPIWIDDKKGIDNRLSVINTNAYTSRNEWQPPLNEVFKATTLRSVVYKNDQKLNEVVTQTYFVDENIESMYTFPVISINTDEDNLFGEEMGLFVPGIHYNDYDPDPMMTGNYFQRGREWERQISFEFFESNGQPVLAQDLGLRIHGGSSRVEPQKSLRLYARNEYGKSSLNYRFFEDEPLNEFKRLILRASGNEWGNTMLLDALGQHIVKDMNFETQASQPSIVFINGEYWGIHNIRERYDDSYFEIKYGVPKDEIVILTKNGEIDTGVEGDEQHYLDMLDFIRNHDITLEENYEYINTLMDIENYIDYQIAEIYFANIDWPQGNIDYWRKKTDAYIPDAPYGHDGRWRWLLYDLDCSFGFWGTSYETNSMEMASDPNYNHNGSWGGEWEWSTFLFSSLLENTTFRDQFINTFADHLNTTFEIERVIDEINRFEKIYDPEIQEHMLRWGRTDSKSDWYESVDVFRDFARYRPTYVRQHIMDRFGLIGVAQVIIDVKDDFQGTIKINSLEMDSSQLPFEGIYFKGVPIIIETENGKTMVELDQEVQRIMVE